MSCRKAILSPLHFRSNRFIILFICSCSLLFLSVHTASSKMKAIARDSESIYLEDIPGLDPIFLKITKLTGLYGERLLQFLTRNVIQGSEVELIAYHKDAYLIRTTSPSYEGWVSTNDITPLGEDIIERINAEMKQQQKFAAAIKQKNVIPGMNFDQVKKVLGRPTSESFRVDATGRMDTWSYVEYKNEYESRRLFDSYTGRYYYQTYTIKVPVGTLDVEFLDGTVVALERYKDDQKRRNIRLKTAPIYSTN
ncbi:MAG: hypothetical protein AAF984_02145 [Verrucomicrobiota bacterium]